MDYKAKKHFGVKPTNRIMLNMRGDLEKPETTLKLPPIFSHYTRQENVKMKVLEKSGPSAPSKPSRFVRTKGPKPQNWKPFFPTNCISSGRPFHTPVHPAPVPPTVCSSVKAPVPKTVNNNTTRQASLERGQSKEEPLVEPVLTSTEPLDSPKVELGEVLRLLRDEDSVSSVKLFHTPVPPAVRSSVKAPVPVSSGKVPQRVDLGRCRQVKTVNNNATRQASLERGRSKEEPLVEPVLTSTEPLDSPKVELGEVLRLLRDEDSVSSVKLFQTPVPPAPVPPAVRSSVKAPVPVSSGKVPQRVGLGRCRQVKIVNNNTTPQASLERPQSKEEPLVEPVLTSTEPLDSPKVELGEVLRLLRDEDSNKNIEGLKLVEGLAEHHIKVVLSDYHNVNTAVNKLVNKPWDVSEVAKSTLTKLAFYVQRKMNKDLEALGL